MECVRSARPVRPTWRAGAALSASALSGPDAGPSAGTGASRVFTMQPRATQRANSLSAALRASELIASSVNTARKRSFPGPRLSDLRSGIERGSRGCTALLAHGFSPPGRGLKLRRGRLAPGGVPWAWPGTIWVECTVLCQAVRGVTRLALAALGMDQRPARPALGGACRCALIVFRAHRHWHGLAEKGACGPQSAGR